MSVAQMDVMIEVDKNLLFRMGAEGASRYALEKLRHGAEAEASAVGGYVITDRHPELIVKQGQSLEHGDDVVMMGARFWIEVPRSFDPTTRNHVAQLGAFGQVV